jgi:hypothetical protein
VPAKKGLSAACSRSGQIGIFVTYHAQVLECLGVGWLRAVIIERRQAVVRPGVEAHHLRFLCVHRQRFPAVGISSEPKL